MAPKPKARPTDFSAEAKAAPRSILGLMAPHVEWLQVRGLSEHTIHRRCYPLRSFAAWCEARGIREPREVTKPILERYQWHLFHVRGENGAPLTFRTQFSYLLGIKEFFRFLAKKNYILSNPASDLEMPKVSKRLPRDLMTHEEVEKVLGLPDTGEPLGIRDRAMLETLYSTGIRRMELLRLQIFDLDSRGTILIREGKGKKDRMIPIGGRALAWVRKYLDDVRPTLAVTPDEGVLFLTYTGEAFRPDGLTRMVGRYVDMAGIGKKGSCHMFRHTMATLMLEGGADVRFIQQMLGHESLDTTAIYTQVSILKLKEVHDATHPGASLKSRREEERSIAPDPAGP